MSFQQHTTYEQSMKLKELGMEQGACYELHLETVGPVRVHAPCTEECAHRKTRQELEDFIMERAEIATLFLRDDYTVYINPDVRHAEILDAQRRLYDEKDPFTAVYEAACYILEHPEQFPVPTQST